MEAKELNLVDSLKLASILIKYVDINSLSPEQTALEFIESLVTRISPRDYSDILSLFTGEPVYRVYEKLEKDGGQSILELLFSGLEKNKIVSLLDTYSKIGFS